jgi:hypothetical protein
MKVKDKDLFMRYAIPCADTLVKRGSITQEKLVELIGKMACGKMFSDEDTDIFKVAKVHCTLMAKKSGKSEIDSEIIEEYFLERHDEVVDDRFKLMGDFDPERCRVKSGEVMSVADRKALVKTRKGESEYRTDFIPGVKKGDTVIVHRDFIVKKN